MAPPFLPKYSVEYAFTITLKPKIFDKEPEVQLDKTASHIKSLLSSLTIAYTLVAELTKNYNIHYHGIIKFPLKNKDLMKEFYKCFRGDVMVGFVNIRQIDDKPKWIDYISKDLCRTKNAIIRRPIINDMLDVFDNDQRALYGVTW